MQKVWLLLLALVVLTAAAEAQPYDFVTEGFNLLCGVGVPLLDKGVEWVPGVAERDAGINAIAPAGNGRVLAALDQSRIQLAFIEPDGTRTPFFNGANGYTAWTMVVDRDGNVYVIATQGTGPFPYHLIKIAADGTLQGTHALPFPTASPLAAVRIDLAADQCTLFAVTTHSFSATTDSIRRYDVCTNTALPDFTTLAPSQGGVVKILPNGDVLLADSKFPDYVLLRYDMGGTLVRTYTLPLSGLGGIGLSRDGSAVLAGERCEHRVIEIDLASGTVIREVATEYVNSFEAIISSRGFTAAIGPLAASDIPTASTFGLFALVVLLVATAVRRLM